VKKAIIIHAWGSASGEHWYQKEKNILEQMGYQVYVPNMPKTNNPVLSEWLQVIDNYRPDKDTIIMGHSLGVPTILRFLENSDTKIDKAILVAGFTKDLGFDETRNFVEEPFSWDKIKTKSRKFVVLNQKNDPWVPYEAGQELANNLGVVIIGVDGNNHFDTMDIDLINKEL